MNDAGRDKNHGFRACLAAGGDDTDADKKELREKKMNKTAASPFRRSFRRSLTGRIWLYFYELAILLAGLMLAMGPVHASFTQHFIINKLYDRNTVSFTAAEPAGIRPGDVIPVYRFDAQCKSEIGKVKVAAVQDREVICSYDPTTFRWPMGRHGRVLEHEGTRAEVNLGADHGFRQDDWLVVYRERNPICGIRLTDVSSDRSSGEIRGMFQGDLTGLTVSEYTVPTQAVYFNTPLLSVLEVGILVCSAVVHFALFTRGVRIFSCFAGLLRLAGALARNGAFRFTVNVLAAFPFVWLLAKGSVLLVYRALLFLFSPGMPFAGFQIPRLHPQLWVAGAWALGLAVYFVVLARKRRSPILLLWEKTRFRSRPCTRCRDLRTWGLHLVIACVFGSSLVYFLKANLISMYEMLYPLAAGVVEPGKIDLWRLFSAAPRVSNYEELFAVIRYALWSVTIVGCLLGYLHSILGYLWGKKIRALDFTVGGWIVNAVCYGPLLGWVFWGVVPSYVGQDPIFTGSSFSCINLCVELLLNTLYTLSVWNLGTMFGVMTDKGVKTSGVYSVVRHPSYTLESLMFVALEMKGLSGPVQWFSAAMFIMIYLIRSQREDDFMSASNPRYIAYKQDTPSKFLPGLL
jgi:protein-S-isoprenylcysteine O-methyltransferase Ste14